MNIVTENQTSFYMYDNAFSMLKIRYLHFGVSPLTAQKIVQSIPISSRRILKIGGDNVLLS